MQIELTFKEVNQIQDGLKFLSGLKGDKKNSIPFEFRHNVMMWIDESLVQLKVYSDEQNRLLEEFGDPIYAKESVINNNLGAKVTNYNEDGNEKLVYWRQTIPLEDMKDYEKQLEDVNNTKVTIGKVKKIKLSELVKLEKEKIIDPIAASILYSLHPILEKDIEGVEED